MVGDVEPDLNGETADREMQSDPLGPTPRTTIDVADEKKTSESVLPMSNLGKTLIGTSYAQHQNDRNPILYKETEIM